MVAPGIPKSVSRSAAALRVRDRCFASRHGVKTLPASGTPFSTANVAAALSSTDSPL